MVLERKALDLMVFNGSQPMQWIQWFQWLESNHWCHWNGIGFSSIKLDETSMVFNGSPLLVLLKIVFRFKKDLDWQPRCAVHRPDPNAYCASHKETGQPRSAKQITTFSAIKMAKYCPQGSGTRRQQLLMMH